MGTDRVCVCVCVCTCVHGHAVLYTVDAVVHSDQNQRKKRKSLFFVIIRFTSIIDRYSIIVQLSFYITLSVLFLHLYKYIGLSANRQCRANGENAILQY